MALQTATQAPEQITSRLQAQHKATTNVNLRTFVEEARPDWSEAQVEAVLMKLEKIKIDNVIQFVAALRERGVWKNGALNKKLAAVEEKTFLEGTLAALRMQADVLEERLKPPEVRVVGARGIRRRPPGSENQPQHDAAAVSPSPVMPSQRFWVVPMLLRVYERPELDSPVLGSKSRSEIVVAVAESFDGWVRLAGEGGPGPFLSPGGWMPKEAQRGGTALLLPVGEALELVMPKVLGESGPWGLTIVASPHVVERVAPTETAPPLGLRMAGEHVLAEEQTYGGWVRLAGGDNCWVPIYDPESGAQLCSAAPRQGGTDWSAVGLMEATELLKEAIAGSKRHGLQGAMSSARITGLKNLVADLQQKDRRRQELYDRIDRAGVTGNEQALKICAAEAHDAGLPDEAAWAWLELAAEDRAQAAPEHARLLERLALAASTPDCPVGELRDARDACRSAGIPKKEIARVYALHNNS